MSLYRDVGVVLRTHKLGESDRIVTLITQDSGKVRAVAKGIRKTTSKFGSRLEPMSHVQVQLYRGRQLDIVNQVELVEISTATRANLEATTDGLAMCEVVEQLSEDRSPSPHLYRMLVGALRQLNVAYSAVLLPALQLRLLEEEGVGPRVDRCVVCETSDDLVAIDVQGGGVQCLQHRRGVPISVPALEVLRDVLNGRVASVLRRQDLPVQAVREVVSFARGAMEHHLERRIRSSSLFEAPQP
ncbi:MAG: DNA repair protein RecO [Ilumatobacteraceae bacterium]